jgi:hypothetical protein
LDLVQNASASEQQQLGDDELRDDWRKTVLEHASMDLSFPTDKLPALQDVARRFEKQKMGKYFAGLWGDTLIDWLGLTPFSLDTFHWSGTEPMQVRYTILAKVVYAETTPLGSDPKGPVRAREVHICSPWKQLTNVRVLKRWLDESEERTDSDLAHMSSTTGTIWTSRSIDSSLHVTETSLEVVEIIVMQYAATDHVNYGIPALRINRDFEPHTSEYRAPRHNPMHANFREGR